MRVRCNERMMVMTKRRMVYLVLIGLLVSSGAFAQSAFVGDWKGTIGPDSLNLGVLVSFEESFQGLSGTIDIPAQGADGLELELSDITESNATFAIVGVPGNPTFDGILDGDVIEGTFTQGGQEIPFVLERVIEGQVSGVETINAYLGIWNGSIDEAGLDVSVTFSDANGIMQGEISIPVQSFTGALFIEDVSEDGIVFVIEGVPGNPTFEGKLEGDALSGEFRQASLQSPFALERSEEELSLNRPQEPQPPYPYLEEEVTYKNGNISLAGTLTLPEEGAPFTALLMITGSGAQDRNEELVGHKPFLVIADHLTRAGYAVLRVDDRGVGGSTGDNSESTYEDFTADILAGVDFLLAREDIAQVGLFGHSEGGMTAPIAASQSDDISFVILMAAPSVPGSEILLEQSELILRANDVGQAMIDSQIVFLNNLFVALENDDKDEIERLVTAQVTLEFEQSDEERDPDLLEQVLEAQLNVINSANYRAIVFHDPQPYLEQLKMPVLAFYGSKDLQVPPSQSAEPMQQALSNNTDATVEIFEGLNHLMQEAETGTIDEYAQIEETVNVEVLEFVTDWLDARF